MERIFMSPGKYVQGPGVLNDSGSYLNTIGQRFILLCDAFVWELCGEDFVTRLETQGISVTRLDFQGESSSEELARLSIISESLAAQGVIGLGGGKTLDSGKALANHLDLPVVVIPTTAATDAATSAIAVAYTADGLFKHYDHYHQSPSLVLVDSQLIFNAPPHLLVDGIADALATALEVRAVVANPEALALTGGRPTLTAQAIAEKCEAVLFAEAAQALADQQNGQLSQAFENIVEANTLLSGLGFESGGLAAAHAIQNGLSSVGGPLSRVSHGRKVAYGILIHLLLTEASAGELKQYLHFYTDLGLPRNLTELCGVALSQAEKAKIAHQATIPSETIHYLTGQQTATRVLEAMNNLENMTH